ncbi:MAG TPA: hypothetical protein VMW50_04415 [Dehalococcoidia bacterium]|nr:hypothetical protein [Dehalococcoidia bacterium]
MLRSRLLRATREINTLPTATPYANNFSGWALYFSGAQTNNFKNFVSGNLLVASGCSVTAPTPANIGYERLFSGENYYFAGGHDYTFAFRHGRAWYTGVPNGFPDSYTAKLFGYSDFAGTQSEMEIYTTTTGGGTESSTVAHQFVMPFGTKSIKMRFYGTVSFAFDAGVPSRRAGTYWENSIVSKD